MVTVAIPTRTRLDLLRPLVKSLRDEDELGELLILDNGHDSDAVLEMKGWEAADERIRVLAMPDANIYEMWNFAIDLANDILDSRHLLLLNDDVSIPLGMLGGMREALDSVENLWVISADYDPRPVLSFGTISYVSGTYSNLGMAGFAFMFDPQNGVRFDEQFKHWYGDDDFAAQIEAAGGRIGVLNGYRVGHVGGATSYEFPELAEVIATDAEKYRKKWRRE